MSIPRITENSAFELDFICKNSDAALQAPTTLHYQIYCLTSQVEIRASTPISAASSGTVDMLPADSVLQSQDNETELRLVTITADLGLDTQFNKTALYEVVNLRAIT